MAEEHFQRPVYEREKDIKAAREVARRFGEGGAFRIIHTPPYHPVDFLYEINKGPFAGLEAKRRHITRLRYPDIIISKRKIDSAVDFCLQVFIPMYFGVWFNDGIYFAKLFDPWSGMRRMAERWAGREDRNDPHDMEPCYLVPSRWFMNRTLQEQKDVTDERPTRPVPIPIYVDKGG